MDIYMTEGTAISCSVKKNSLKLSFQCAGQWPNSIIK